MKYAVVIERGPTSYGASVPDLPGCIAVGQTREDVERLVPEAMASYLLGLRSRGRPIPEPRTHVTSVEISDDDVDRHAARRPRPGVYKFRSIEEMDAAQEEWAKPSALSPQP